MAKRFEGDVVIVTGGSSGIGRVTALAFAAEGARVVVSSRRENESNETVRLIEAGGGDAVFVKTDTAESADVQRLVSETIRIYGRLNFAFNNAGIEGDSFVPIDRYSEDTWARVLAVNLTGVFLCMKYQLPHIQQTRGAIVNMASISGMAGSRIGVAYVASKHGVVGLTKAAALEYADKGVRINAVAPAVTKTDMAERAFFHDPAITAAVLARHPMGRAGESEEVAKAVLWLCSKDASFTTGHVLPIDGGYLIP